MKRLFGVFVLTPSEQRLVIFVVLALVLGAWLKHHREIKLNDTPIPSAELSATPFVSPPPNER